jgi:hypothetical protein
MHAIKICCTLLWDAKVPFNPENMEPSFTILSQIFCLKRMVIIRNPKRDKVFHHRFYHRSSAWNARLSSGIQKGTKFSITYFITDLLLETHGYHPESKKGQSFPSHILSHVFCRKSKAIVNPQRYSFWVPLVYGKLPWCISMKIQYHNHRFESKLSISTCNILNHQLKCNIMIMNSKSH